jgi:hypothetical protein
LVDHASRVPAARTHRDADAAVGSRPFNRMRVAAGDKSRDRAPGSTGRRDEVTDVGRSWNEVKADKERHDRAAGRDVDAAREHARMVTDAYILGYRLGQLREELGLTQTQVAERMGDQSAAREPTREG